MCVSCRAFHADDGPLSVSFQVEKIRQVKAKSLYLQVEKLHQSLTKLDSTIAAVSQVLDEGRHLDVLLARERMLTQIHELKALRGLLQAQDDDRFMFTPPDQVGPSRSWIINKWSAPEAWMCFNIVFAQPDVILVVVGEELWLVNLGDNLNQ